MPLIGRDLTVDVKSRINFFLELSDFIICATFQMEIFAWRSKLAEEIKYKKLKKQNAYAIAGLIFGILSPFWGFTYEVIPLLAVACSGLGLLNVKTCEGSGKVLAWIGLVLGIIFMLAVHDWLYGIWYWLAFPEYSWRMFWR